MLILRNHGLLVVGASVPEAFIESWSLQRACEVQVAPGSMPGPNHAIPEAVLRAIPAQRKPMQPGTVGPTSRSSTRCCGSQASATKTSSPTEGAPHADHDRCRQACKQLLGIELPIVQAPMAGVQLGALAIAVGRAGGLGSLPGALLTPTALRSELAAVVSATDRPFNLNFFCHAVPPARCARASDAWQRGAATLLRRARRRAGRPCAGGRPGRPSVTTSPT